MAANGFLLIDKPEGPTSFRILGPVRHRYSGERIGYAGTLDSGASGLLIVAVGPSRKLLSLLEADEKEYSFRLHLGFATDTGDLTGRRTESAEGAARPRDELLRAIPAFLGRIAQVPPAYSALKVKGKRASDLARKGRDVELAAREVESRELELLPDAADDGSPRTEFDLRCVVSKGTYVRSLGRDLAKALGTIGCVSGIRRLRIGNARVENAWKWNRVDPVPDLVPPEELLPFPKLTGSEFDLRLASNGVRIDLVRLRSETVDPRSMRAGDRFFVADASGRALFCADAVPGVDDAVAPGAGTGLVVSIRALFAGGADG